ncbi:flagellar motor protein MotD [Dyella sp. A6]|uniref:flagellar motor protein MotD n=1 Tax=Dyella aluminiiresistens TaxID=3069105 RepID=UPI002E76BF4D|nr:flagellar motor protein MotD [Dyella sp. A6]
MRRKRHEEHVNHEAWAIPYADLLTLLLAFFVVMYAVSVVNEGKYRVMSESIIEAFNGTAPRVVPAQGNMPTPIAPVPAARTDSPSYATMKPRLRLPLPTRNVMASTMQKGALAGKVGETRNLEQIRKEVEQALKPLIDKGMVAVRANKDWLEIEIRTDILFRSGAAHLSDQADQVLHGLASILAPYSNPLRIEGYTDDVPIDTSLYPSNWELSAARAASVARLFSDHGVDPKRLGIIGWSEYHPAASNDTAAGRNRNRRVLVVVLSNHYRLNRFGSGVPDSSALGDTSPATPSPSAPSPSTPSATPASTPVPNPIVTVANLPASTDATSGGGHG